MSPEASCGGVEFAQWLMSVRGPEDIRIAAIMRAAIEGNLRIVKWFDAKASEWVLDFPSSKAPRDGSASIHAVFEAAARSGQMHIVPRRADDGWEAGGNWRLRVVHFLPSHRCDECA
jgi:hypothetical protein